MICFVSSCSCHLIHIAASNDQNAFARETGVNLCTDFIYWVETEVVCYLGVWSFATMQKY